MAFVDTNVVLRWLLDDHPLSTEAQRLVAGAKDRSLVITDVVAAEIVYVFGGLQKDRGQVQDAFNLLRQSPAFVFESDSIIRQTVQLLAASKLDFADCYLITCATQAKQELMTFDKTMRRAYDEIMKARRKA